MTTTELSIELQEKIQAEVNAYLDSVKDNGAEWFVWHAQEVLIATRMLDFIDTITGSIDTFCEYHPEDAETLLYSDDLVAHAIEAFNNTKYEQLPNLAMDEGIDELMRNTAYDLRAMGKAITQNAEKLAEKLGSEYTVAAGALYEEDEAYNGYVLAFQKNGEELTAPLRGEGDLLPYCNRIEDEEVVQELVEQDIAVVIGSMYYAPVVMFNPEKLQELDAEGLADYESKAGITPEIRSEAIAMYQESNAKGAEKANNRNEHEHDI